MDSGLPFGALLRRSRKGCRLTQEALAQAASCALDTIKKLEGNRRRPSRHLAVQLADVLGLEGDRREAFLAAARRPADMASLSSQAERPIEAAAPATLTIARRHVPRGATPFIGRQRELNDLIAHLRDPDVRLVALVAPGGMGKTRLALAAAEQLAQQHAFRDGVAFADLTAIDTTAELEIALADGLGLPLDSRGPSPRRQLLDYLQSKELLLLLDNCEQLLGGLAELTAAILHEAPEVSLLATSRERLGLQAERVLPLDGLDVGDDGAALFAISARCTRPDFELDAHSRLLVEAICTRLGGMPLAIELAARWTNTLSLTAIGDELAHSQALLVSKASDSSERHRSVRAVCAASWAQLPPADQAVFARMAVFRGGATRPAIQAVTGTTLWQLQTLVEQALIRFDPRCERYEIHELLRQYAEEQLGNDALEERAAHERHARYFLGALADREGALKGAQQWETLATISAEIENVRAAWRWAAETHAVDLLASAIEALSLTYAWLGQHEEGLEAMRLAAAATGNALSQPAAMLRATLLTAQARFALLCGNRAHALDLLEQAEALLAVAGGGTAIDTAMAELLLERGRSLAHQDFAAAHNALTRSKALWEVLSNRWGVATSLAELGYLLTNMSPNYSEAKALLERSAACYRVLGDQIGLSEALMRLCLTNRNIGHFPEALAIAREVYAIAEANGNARLLAQAGSTLGTMLAICSQYQEAYARLTAALSLTQELGRRRDLPNLYCVQGYVAAFLGHYQEARNSYNHGLHIAQQLGDELERCSLLSGLAGTALAEGIYAEALSLANEALLLSDRLGEGYVRSRTLPYRALAMRGLGIGDCGRSDALVTLRLGLTARSEILVALWAVALLLADAGELTRTAQVFALSEQQRQLDNVWLQDLALRELQSIIARLPPGVAAQARSRWEQHDSWSALEELCAELEESWSLS